MTDQKKTVKTWKIGERPWVVVGSRYDTLVQATIVYVWSYRRGEGEPRYYATYSEYPGDGEHFADFRADQFYTSREERTSKVAEGHVSRVLFDIQNAKVGILREKKRIIEMQEKLPALRKAAAEAKKAYAATQKKPRAIATESATTAAGAE